MPKLLRTSEKILFVLNFFGDFLEDERNPLGLFSSSYRSVFSFSSNKKKRNHFQQALSRLVRSALVERKKSDHGSFLKLTSLGRNKLVRDFPNLNRRPARPWDGHWRLVSFDVTEPYRKIRNLLREILKDFGFERLQESLYICPFGLENELKNYLMGTKLDRFVRIFIVLKTGADKEMAEKLWHLGEINEKYQRILKDFEVNGNKALLRERFLEVASLDPNLPIDLLPDDWIGSYVEKKALEKTNKVS